MPNTDERRRQLFPVGIVATAVVLALPYALAGPGFFADDWFALRDARIGEWYMPAGPDQWRARPGVGAIYAVMFGLVEDRPMVHFVVAMSLVSVAALLLFRIASRFETRPVAAAIALAWLVVPNHTSLEMWPSAINILMSLVLLLVGFDALTAATGRRRETESHRVVGFEV